MAEVQPTADEPDPRRSARVTSSFEVYEDGTGHWWWLLHGERGPIAGAEAALASEAAAWRECAEVKRAAAGGTTAEPDVHTHEPPLTLSQALPGALDAVPVGHGHGDVPKPMRDRLFVALLMALLDAGYSDVTVELLARMLDAGLRNYSRFDAPRAEELSEA